MPFSGIIIEESLKDASLLRDLHIVSTTIENVTNDHHTPWLTQWTMHTVEIPEEQADLIAKAISHELDRPSSWYADFKNNEIHYVIFKDKVFRIDRSKREQYDEATSYGISVGIPAHQVDFSPHIRSWKMPGE